ncbi:zinc ribbon domain-containing protein [bacterium]|nr:zinc ribbon domain-containing protein [bacterium]
MGNKYEKFCNHLKKANKKGIKTLTLPVKEIERINGYLPPSAKKFPNFWSNYKQFWLEAGYAVKAVFKEDSKIIIFEKVSEPKNYEETEKPIDDDTTNTNEEDNECRCANCGKAIKKDFDFCPYCGASQIKKCPNCGTVLKEDFKFCPKCGEKLVPGNDAQNPSTTR